SFKANGNQLEKTAESHFDPWGLKLTGVGSVNATQNRWELQGHEKEETFGLNRVNFGARTFNPTIGKFDRIDNFSEKYSAFSPYQYALNNPIGFIDINGDSTAVPDFQWTDGYATYSSRNSTAGVSFYGTYQNTQIGNSVSQFFSNLKDMIT